MQNKSNYPNSAQNFWVEYNRKMRKLRLILTGVIVFMLLCATSLMLLLNQEAQKQAQTVKPTIALVDEDQSASFNGSDYNFGQSFVNLVSNDNKYNWQVVSRSVADRAYSEGSVQAVIYLPQDFSHNILTLQAIDPQKAQVDYKILNSQSKLTNNLLQDKIVNILYDFNSSIVKMYYASVAGNVASAQSNMNNVVNSQGTILTNLKNNVYGPFQTTNQSYRSVISVANGLKAQNESWIQAQNSFTHSVTTMLNANSSAFNRQLPNLLTYFTTQKQITDINLGNANQGIFNQADSDHSYYYAQYTAAYHQALQTMQQFSATDSSGNESGLYRQLKDKIADYNALISDLRDNIDRQMSSLTEKQTTLLALEQKLYSEFFAQTVSPRVEATDFTSLESEDNARVALANLLANSFGKTDNISKLPYNKVINDLIRKLSVERSQYDTLLSTLVSNRSMTQSQKDQIDGQLALLSTYARYFGLPTASVDFTAAPTANTTSQTFTKKLVITVPATKRYTLTLQASNGISNRNVSLASAVDENGTSLTITNPNSISLDNRTKVSTDSNGNPTTVAATQAMTYTMSYNVNLDQAASGTVIATWDNASGSKDQSTDNFGLIPAHSISEYAGGNQFGYLTTLFNNIDTASHLIAFLYGAPGADYSAITSTDFNFDTAPEQSVFKMYGNMDAAQIASRLSAEDVTQFKNWGSKAIQDVTGTLAVLESSLSAMSAEKATLSRHLPTDVFSQISNDLSAWYDQTMRLLDERYRAWTGNTTSLLEEKPWTDYQPEETALYYDKANSDVLYATLSGLVSTSAQQAKETADSAQIIKSNASEFKQMVDQVTQSQNVAQTVIDNTGRLLSSGNGDLKKSQTYSDNFASVLSNTRTTGVDTDTVFSFFAKPLAIKDLTPKVKSITQGFDWRWLLLFIIGLLLGVLGKTWIRQKARKDEN